MSELLKSLKIKKNELDLRVSTLTLNITNINDTCSTRMRDILSSKFPRIRNILIGNANITIQVRSDDERYTHDVSVSNQNSVYSSTFTYNPKIAWNSGSITRTAITLTSYINVVAFIAAEILKSESEFSKLMETAWGSVFNMNNELIGLKNDLNRTNRDITWEEERIKKEEFFNNLKAGNFYYKLRSSYGRSLVYDIIKVEKINRKTVAVMTHASYSDPRMLECFDRDGMSVKRIENYKIYEVLRTFTLFDKKDFLEMIMDHKYQIGIDYVAKNCGLSSVNDIKTLCIKLKEFNITDSNVPSNEVLHYISKWRHKTLQVNRT